MKFVFLILGTLFSFLFIIQCFRGRKYENIFQNLDESTNPLKALYSVGFAWNQTKIFKLSGTLEYNLIKSAKKLYSPQFADFYANVAWAKTLMFANLLLAVTCLMCVIMYEIFVFVLVVGCFFIVLITSYCLEELSNNLNKRKESCEIDLPEVVSTMAILVNSGMSLREAWNIIGEKGHGDLHFLMHEASENMRNGYSEVDAIYLFGKSSNSGDINKFSSLLIQSIQKGGAELTSFLTNQSSELWNNKRQFLLQKGEKAATKLLLPIVLIFIGVIIIVMTAAFAGSLFG